MIDNVVHFEMFFERETKVAVSTGEVSWYGGKDKEHYRCDGLDPKIFPSRTNMKPEVPMKPWSPDHWIALKWFTRATKAGSVSFPPTYLLVARMPALSFLQYCLCGDIVIHSERDTYGFRKPVNAFNYPDIEMEMREYPGIE